MSKYTTELRFICETYAGLEESADNDNVNNIIDTALPKLFNFDYPIFDEIYRPILERKIVRHYYTREIGYETVGRWKMALENKLNEIMPYYNKLYNSELLEFNPLYTHNITKTGHKTNDETTTQTSEETTNHTFNESTTGHHNNTLTGEAHDNNTGNTSKTNYNLHSDTPQGGLQGVDSETYLSDATKTTDQGNSQDIKNHNSTNTDIGNENGTKENTTQGNIQGNKRGTANNVGEYLETVVGYEGKNASKSLMEYRQTFLNIDMQIIEELNKLFMCIW